MVGGTDATVVIRKARLDEKDVLTELCLRSKQSNGYDDAFIAACVEELSVRDSWVLHDHFWVAETADGQCAGCIRLQADNKSRDGELATFFVDPDHQGKGVGRLLFDEFICKANDLNLARIGLDADPEAETIYEKLGFRTIGRSPSGSIPGRMLPRMEMVLTRYETGHLT